MTDNNQENQNQLDPVAGSDTPSRLSENLANEHGAFEIRRETTETIRHKQVREVVRYEKAVLSIPLGELANPAVAQALLDECNYWREQVAEKDESILELREQVHKLTSANHQLDKQTALLESHSTQNSRVSSLEAFLLALGGVFLGSGINSPNSPMIWIAGAGMMIVATVSTFCRARATKTGNR